MLYYILLGLGLAAVIEGLVLALAPLRFEDVLEALRRLPVEQRRALGLSIMAFGVVLVWIAQSVLA